MDLLNSIQNLIKKAQITGGADNESHFAKQQIVYHNQVTDCAMLFPFGMYANASSSDSLVTVFVIGDNEEDKIGIPYAPLKRPRDLEQGEVALYHPETETFIKFRNSGNLEIESGGGGEGIITIKGAVTIDGAVTIAGGATIDDLTVTGTSTLGSTVTSGGVDISNTHTHTQPNDGGGNVEAPTSVPV